MEKVRYLNKNVTTQERLNFSGWWYEQIQQYGVQVNYYTNGYQLSGQNYLYGEDPTAAYVETGPVIMLTDITNDAIMLSKFGILADCDMTAVMHVSGFYNTFGPGREPKAGDLIELQEYGGYGDRPGGRGAPIYEVTERDDENLAMNANTLMGHYIWIMKCRRWEGSNEPGAPHEPANTQINDAGEYGVLPGGVSPPDLVQPYPDSANTEGQQVFDQDQANEQGSPYGYYGL